MTYAAAELSERLAAAGEYSARKVEQELYLPELAADLVPALPCLDAHNFPHDNTGNRLKVQRKRGASKLWVKEENCELSLEAKWRGLLPEFKQRTCTEVAGSRALQGFAPALPLGRSLICAV